MSGVVLGLLELAQCPLLRSAGGNEALPIPKEGVGGYRLGWIPPQEAGSVADTGQWAGKLSC